MHGGAYLDPAPLQIQRSEVEARLQKLRAAEERAGTEKDRNRLHNAVREHEKQLEQIEELLKASA